MTTLLEEQTAAAEARRAALRAEALAGMQRTIRHAQAVAANRAERRAEVRKAARRSRRRQPAQIDPAALAHGIHTMTGALERVKAGTASVAAAQGLLEAYAPALPPEVFDAALDALGDIAAQTGQPLREVDWHLARTRRPADGLDAETRFRRRREAAQHRRTIGKGANPTARVEANDATRVTAAVAWRGETGSTAHLCGEVIPLRPVWAVSPDGTVADAAEVFAVRPAEVRHAVGEAIEYAGANGKRGRLVTAPAFGEPYRYRTEVVQPWVSCACVPTPQQAAKAAEKGQPWACRNKGHRISPRAVGTAEAVMVVEDRRQWAEFRETGPSSPWRVPSVPAYSPLLEEAAAWRARAHDARLAELERREAYQRNGWAHGLVADASPTEPRDGFRATRQQAHPVCPTCRRMHAGGPCAPLHRCGEVCDVRCPAYAGGVTVEEIAARVAHHTAHGRDGAEVLLAAVAEGGPAVAAAAAAQAVAAARLAAQAAAEVLGT